METWRGSGLFNWSDVDISSIAPLKILQLTVTNTNVLSRTLFESDIRINLWSTPEARRREVPIVLSYLVQGYSCFKIFLWLCFRFLVPFFAYLSHSRIMCLCCVVCFWQHCFCCWISIETYEARSIGLKWLFFTFRLTLIWILSRCRFLLCIWIDRF